MRGLIWKELREKRLWAALVFLVLVILMTLGSTLYFSGNMDNGLSLVLILGSSLIFGAALWKSELEGGAVDFLYTRNASRPAILAVKLGVAFGLISLVSVLGSMLFYLIGPSQYIGAVEAEGFMVGCLKLIGVQVLGASFGMAFFVAAGKLGLAYIGSLFFYTLLMIALRSEASFFQQKPTGWLILGVLSFPLVSLVLTLQRMTESIGNRQRLYARTGLTCITLGLVLHLSEIPGAEFARMDTEGGGVAVELSPRFSHGMYAFITDHNVTQTAFRSDHTFQDGYYESALQLTPLRATGRVYPVEAIQTRPFRLKDHVEWRLPDSQQRTPALHSGKRFIDPDDFEIVGFSENHGLIVLPLAERYDWMKDSVLVYPTISRPVSAIRFDPGMFVSSEGFRSNARKTLASVSPEGRFLAVYRTSPEHQEPVLVVADLEEKKTLPVAIEAPQYFWWQSDDSIGFVDQQGQRPILELKP